MAINKNTSAKMNSHGAQTTHPGQIAKPKTPSTKKIGAKSIAVRAYEIYCERRDKGLPGDSRTDWLRAEKEILGT